MIRETFPNVSSTDERLRAHRDVVGRHRDRRARTPSTSPPPSGPPVPTVSVKIADDQGNEVATGETGEVCITGPILMAGYWNKPEATAEAIRDGWLHTGDLGHLDEDGFLYITDRKKDMIIRGGENIYSIEIEQRLVDHPDIADAAIYGVPHPELGEEVKATVQLEEGADPHRGRREAVGGRRPRRLQGAGLRRPHLRQAPPQRQRQAPQERAPRRGRRQLRGDDVARRCASAPSASDEHDHRRHLDDDRERPPRATGSSRPRGSRGCRRRDGSWRRRRATRG